MGDIQITPKVDWPNREELVLWVTDTASTHLALVACRHCGNANVVARR